MSAKSIGLLSLFLSSKVRRLKFLVDISKVCRKTQIRISGGDVDGFYVKQPFLQAKC